MNAKCGQRYIVASPGSSNHNDGNAVDIGDFDGWRKYLHAVDGGDKFLQPGGDDQQAYGSRFKWYGPGDRVHFTYVGPDKVSRTYKDGDNSALLAFVNLWNANNPESERIEPKRWLHGADAMVASALSRSPRHGFPTGPSLDSMLVRMAEERERQRCEPCMEARKAKVEAELAALERYENHFEVAQDHPLIALPFHRYGEVKVDEEVPQSIHQALGSWLVPADGLCTLTGLDKPAEMFADQVQCLVGDWLTRVDAGSDALRLSGRAAQLPLLQPAAAAALLQAVDAGVSLSIMHMWRPMSEEIVLGRMGACGVPAGSVSGKGAMTSGLGFIADTTDISISSDSRSILSTHGWVRKWTRTGLERYEFRGSASGSVRDIYRAQVMVLQMLWNANVPGILGGESTLQGYAEDRLVVDGLIGPNTRSKLDLMSFSPALPIPGVCGCSHGTGVRRVSTGGGEAGDCTVHYRSGLLARKTSSSLKSSWFCDALQSWTRTCAIDMGLSQSDRAGGIGIVDGGRGAAEEEGGGACILRSA